jgi:thiamine-phosphate diphosphorylase
VLELTDRLRGFYAVLDRDDAQLARDLVGPGGARVLQIRIKPGDARTLLAVARMARPICDAAGALLIVNDRIDVALAARADGVHLGQTDLAFADARRIAPALIIGISTHTVAQVEAAAGADYLGFGPVFATRTKHAPEPVQGIAGLRAAVAAARGVPIVAIGGIEPRAVSDIYAAGATAICAIRSVNESDEPILAARSFAATRVT